MRTVLATQSHCPEINVLVGEFVSQCIWGEGGRYKDFCSMAVIDTDDVMIAGLIYHNYTPEFKSIEMSAGCTNRNWMTRGVLKDILDMPFRDLGCDTIIARHSEDKKHLRRMWTRVGAIEYVIPHVRGKGAPAEVVSVLTNEAWLGSKF